MIIYRSPQSTITLGITMPLRGMCGLAFKNPERLIDIEEDMLRLFMQTEDCIAHISSLPLDDINEVLTAKERRKIFMDPQRGDLLKGKDYSKLRVSPNSPLAAQIIEDKVIDMLIFLTFRYTKAFATWKSKNPPDTIESYALHVANAKRGDGDASATAGSRRSQSVRFEGTERTGTVDQTAAGSHHASHSMMRNKRKRAQNHVLQRMTRLLKTLLYEMHSYSTPMAPYVKEVIEYVVRLYVGEEYALGSD